MLTNIFTRMAEVLTAIGNFADNLEKLSVPTRQIISSAENAYSVAINSGDWKLEGARLAVKAGREVVGEKWASDLQPKLNECFSNAMTIWEAIDGWLPDRPQRSA